MALHGHKQLLLVSGYKGLVPLASMPCDPTLEVAVLPMRKWARRKSLGATNKINLMRMSI